MDQHAIDMFIHSLKNTLASRNSTTPTAITISAACCSLLPWSSPEHGAAG
jgi:hypothetical protein